MNDTTKIDIKDHHYLVIDLEATCWARDEVAVGPNEIIEIGLTILSGTKVELWNGGWFVRPIVTPVLSDFCRSLTSINQSHVDSAATFPSVMRAVEEQILAVTGFLAKESLFVSWGDYDRKQFERDCDRHDYPYPFGQHLNLKQEFIHRYGRKRTGLDAALAKIGLSMVGTHHRGKDDALNVARILQHLGPTQK